MNKKDKVIIIPGWMDRSYYHCKWKDLNFWGEEIKLDKKIKEDFIIGHCAGAPIALSIWKNNKDKKVILVNPLLPKRNFLAWVRRFFRFSIKEPLLNPVSRIPMFFRIFTGGFAKLLRAIKIDSIDIIKKIPKENIFIIYGENDNYFFDKEARRIIENIGLKTIEVKDAGHNWNKKFNSEIEKIINS